MNKCIRNGLIVNPESGFMGKGSVWIEGDVIVCIETEVGVAGVMPKWADSPDAIIDAENKWITPALIDLHVHLREPGFEYKEDIASGCAAAAKGGFGTICCMPNTDPAIDCGEAVVYVKNRAKQIGGVTVLPVGAITKGQQGKKLAAIEEMAEQGICAISEDGKSVMNSKLMRDGMLKAAQLNLPVFSHAEDETLASAAISEELIVARDILLAKETGCRLHFCHISTKGSIELIKKAKADGLSVTAETAPHYFTFDASHVKGDGNKKMNPPLRSPEDVQAVIEALKDGTIDAIATDHAPHSREEKTIDFDKALNGVIGLETSFAVSYTMLVKTGILTPLQLIDKMSFRPASILGIKAGVIGVGKPAELTLIDVSTEYEIKKEGFVSKSINSPFVGMRVFGRGERI